MIDQLCKSEIRVEYKEMRDSAIKLSYHGNAPHLDNLCLKHPLKSAYFTHDHYRELEAKKLSDYDL